MALTAFGTTSITTKSVSWSVADGTNPAHTDGDTLPLRHVFVSQILASNVGHTDRTLQVMLSLFSDFCYLGNVLVPAAVGIIAGSVDVLAALPAAYAAGFPIDSHEVDVWFRVNAALDHDYDVEVFASFQY